MYRVKYRYLVGNSVQSGKTDIPGNHMGDAESKVRRDILNKFSNCTIVSVQSIPEWKEQY